jgi:hypothetical protein
MSQSFKVGDIVKPSKEFYKRSDLKKFDFVIAEVVDCTNYSTVFIEYFDGLKPDTKSSEWSESFLELVYREKV